MLVAESQASATDHDHSSSDGIAAVLQRAVAGAMPLSELLEAAPRLDAAQAASLYQSWIAGNPDHPALHAVYFNHGVCLSEAGDLAATVNALREAIRLRPGFGPPYINLGTTLERLGQPGNAVETWLSLAGVHAEVTADTIAYKALALKQAGRVLESSGRAAAAEDALQQSAELDPAQRDALQHIVALRQGQCEWPALAAKGRITAAQLKAAISPLSAAYLADDPIFQLASAYRYARHSIGIPAQRLGKRLAAVAAPEPPPRLRLGYVSSDLRNHAVGFALTDVIETHDPERVEVFAYDCGIATEDATRARIRRATHHWRDLNGLNDLDAARLIRNDGIDILVDLNGYTKDARTGVFALRPAPIAVNWFGFPGSMGSPYHHYLIADAHIIPPSHELYYSEAVLRLPCYQPNDRKRPVGHTRSREALGLPEQGLVLCCLNGQQKFTAPMFACWMQILRAVPGSILWFFASTEATDARLRAAATAEGVAPERLIFAPKLPNPEHLARLQHADIFLDTFPYGAHTTGSDALWMGVPVLTRQGRSFASRVCASLLVAAGVPELICDSAEDYVAKAIALAQDPQRLAALKARLIAGRTTCTLFDTPGLVRCLEALYAEMHAAYRAGTLPRPDLANLDLYHEIAVAEVDPNLDHLEESEYLDHYRQRLAAFDEFFPISSDQRLWSRPA